MEFYLVIAWAASFVIYLVSVQQLRRRFESQLAEKDRIIRLQDEKIKQYEKTK